MALRQLLQSVKDEALDSFSSRSFFWSTRFIEPSWHTCQYTHLLCIHIRPPQQSAEETPNAKPSCEETWKRCQVLQGVMVTRTLSISELKEEICRANPGFAPKGSHPHMLVLRFPGLAVERPYSGTRLKYLDGLTNGSLVISMWSGQGARGRDLPDEAVDEALLIMLRTRQVVPLGLSFEYELHLAQRFGHNDPGTWRGYKPLLVEKGTTSDALRDTVFKSFGKECTGDVHYFSKRRRSTRNALRLYVSYDDLLWQPLPRRGLLGEIVARRGGEEGWSCDAASSGPEADSAGKLLRQAFIDAASGEGVSIKVLCGSCHDLHYEDARYAIGPWEDTDDVAVPASLPGMPPFAVGAGGDVPSVVVYSVAGETLLELSGQDAQVLTVGGLKLRLRQLHGWDTCRQQFINEGGRQLCEWDLLPLPVQEQETSALTLVLADGHPARVALDGGVVFCRTRHEILGKPIYHGHNANGVPCKVHWRLEEEQGWVLKDVVVEVTRRSLARPDSSQEEVKQYLGYAEYLSEVHGATLLSMDELTD
eukprot:TRINITY_DN84435_c0_g1_i1.p1 TRINITY_DN84435_c0_g1~~TRINITY_DN84435_c0_g1_i1.p1  ORF type:complete len:535 (-),score=102.50 TRINITY_DN84435_c0_g1_i1:61-1665(-)